MTGEHVVRIDLTQVRLYHGGVRRLKPGELILPPAQTGAPCASDYGAGNVHRRDRVYLTIDLDAARFYAAMYAGLDAGGRAIKGQGDLYEVTPLAELEHDADAVAPGYSFAVPAARVVRVLERFVRFPAGVTPDEVADIVLGTRGVTLDVLTDLGRQTTAAGRQP